jgi:N-acetylmuramic acid 6-phosphate (MurNAc-6-P) etherase
MSNLQARNTKLRERAVRIVMAESALDQASATRELEASGWNVRKTIDRLKTPK